MSAPGMAFYFRAMAISEVSKYWFSQQRMPRFLEFKEHYSRLVEMGTNEASDALDAMEMNVTEEFRAFPDSDKLMAKEVIQEFLGHIAYSPKYHICVASLQVFILQEDLRMTAEPARLSNNAYAIAHVYLKKVGKAGITKNNKDALGEKYGCSGDDLYNKFCTWKDESNLLSINTTNKRSANQHIDNFTDALNILEVMDSSAKLLAEKDLATIKKQYSKYF